MSELPVAEIGSLVQRVGSWNPTRDGQGQTIQYIDLGAVDNDLKEITAPQSVLAQDAPSRARQLVRAGDVLVSTVRPNLNGVARVPVGLDGSTASTGFCVIRPTRALLAEYLFHWVKSPDFVSIMVRRATGQSYPAVSDRVVLESCIPLPPLDEQRRIAAILDQADTLRRKRREAMQRVGKLASTVFSTEFGHYRAGPAVQVAQLGVLCDLVRGSSPRPQGDPRFFGGPIPRLMIADITRDGMHVTPKIDKLTIAGAKKSRPMKAGSVVMAVSGAVGLPAILAVDACIHDGFVGFRGLSSKILPRFLYYWLNSAREFNARQGTGAIWVNLTTDQVRRFEVPVPPLEDQERFVRFADAVESEGKVSSSHLVYLEHLFASLQHRAFRGEL